MKIVIYLKFIDDYRAYAVVDESLCKGCGMCVEICPFNVPFMTKQKKAKIFPEKCNGCGACAASCKAQSIHMERTLNTAPYTVSHMESKQPQNLMDRSAIETGLALRDQIGGEVWIVGMGPLHYTEAVREALAMDADEGVLLCDERFLGSDCRVSAVILEKTLMKIGGCDILIAPENEGSRETCLSMAWVAERVGMAYLPLIREMEIHGSRLLARRLENQELFEYSLALPVAVTVTPNAYKPRSLSLMAAARAMQKPVSVWSLSDINLEVEQVGEVGSHVRLEKVEAPLVRKVKKKSGQLLKGSPRELAEVFMDHLTKWDLD